MQKGMPSPKKLSLIVALGTVLRESNLIGLADVRFLIEHRHDYFRKVNMRMLIELGHFSIVWD